MIFIFLSGYLTCKTFNHYTEIERYKHTGVPLTDEVMTGVVSGALAIIFAALGYLFS